MSANNYTLIMRGISTRRWYVFHRDMDDDSPIILKPRQEAFRDLEDALREAASHEAEYGIQMGDDIEDGLDKHSEVA